MKNGSINPQFWPLSGCVRYWISGTMAPISQVRKKEQNRVCSGTTTIANASGEAGSLQMWMMAAEMPPVIRRKRKLRVMADASFPERKSFLSDFILQERMNFDNEKRINC